MPANKEWGREFDGGGVSMLSFEAPGGCSREGGFSPLFGIAVAGADSCYCNSGTSGGANMIEYDSMAALQKFLPSNNYNGNDDEEDNRPVDSWSPMDLYSCDDFRMYEFKVRRCMMGKNHDWTDCPFAHPGEKARRRDPRRFHYSGMACPEFRRGSCKRGEDCEYAHGVFECWLHPARYRTQPCKDGRKCRRRVCFFAHTVDQLRVLSGGGGGGVCVRSCAEVAALPSSPAALVGSPRLNDVKVALSPCVAYNGIESGAELATPPSSPAARGGSAISSGLKVEMSGSAASYYKATRNQMLPGSLGLELPEQLRDCYCCSSSPPVSPTSPLPSPSSFPSRQLQSLPSLAIPATSERNLDVALSPSRLHSCRTRTELLSALEQLQLKAYAIEASRAISSPWSFGQQWLQPHHSSRNIPKTFSTTPTYANQVEKWVANESEAETETRRVEAGRLLNPSKTCGRIGSQNCTETDAPDFGWVNELVK